MEKFKWLAEGFRRGLTRISPEINTRVTYLIKFRRRLDLEHPQTLNEKNLWLKLRCYADDPLVKQCADKYRVREYVRACGLGHILNDLIAVYDSPRKIRWKELPQQFALKLNVGCGCNHIVTDLSAESVPALKREVRRWFRSAPGYYLGYSEMQYRGVKPYVLVERSLADPVRGTFPEDYKVYCFHGEAKFILVCVGREAGHPKFYFFDRDWNLARINRDSQAAPADFTLEQPKCLDALLQAAETLSKPFPFVRADFYVDHDRVIFGELTFTPAGAMDNARLPETDRMMGALLRLPAPGTSAGVNG